MTAPARATAPAARPAAAPSRRRAGEPGPRPVAWPLRVLAWLIALPLGLVAVAVPARRLDFLSGQNLLDVIVGTGWSRYWRVLAIAPVWALVTTLLVHLMLYGLRRLGDRRETIRAERAGGRPPEPAPAPAGRSSRSRSRRATRSDGRSR